MTRPRRQLLALSPAVAALFALGLTAPRAELVYHQHRGGEHQHVHADGDAAWLDASFAELHQRHHHHGHDHAHGPAQHHDHDHGEPAWQAAEDSAGGHWHHQPRYQRAVIASAPPVTVDAPLAAAPDHAPSANTRNAAHEPHARGPPSSLPLA